MIAGQTHAAEPRLRFSPTFQLCHSMDGRPFVAKDVEPYSQFWLTERDRTLLTLFPGRGGATTQSVIASFLRLTGQPDTARRRAALARSIAEMREAGLLVGEGDDTSRYDAAMAGDYLAHRPFPKPLSDEIVRAGQLGRTSRVLDLAAGPGSLALALADVSDHVSMMELSSGFVAAARAQARRAGRPLEVLHDSCNRLPHLDGEFDAITVSQALHWLDDVAICRGVCRLLAEGGSFFVVHGALELDSAHPLSYVLGDHTPLGDKAAAPFRAQVAALQRRLALLFEALDAPDVQRIDPAQRWAAPGAGTPSRIAPAGVSLFRQRRPVGAGFARAFLSAQHIAMTGQAPDAFWADLEARCAWATPEQRMARQDWAILQFCRGGEPMHCRGLAGAPLIEFDSPELAAG